MFKAVFRKELPSDLKDFLAGIECNGPLSFYSLDENDQIKAQRLLSLRRVRSYLIDGELFIGTKRQAEKYDRVVEQFNGKEAV